jgi:hypothetical protein
VAAGPRWALAAGAAVVGSGPAALLAGWALELLRACAAGWPGALVHPAASAVASAAAGSTTTDTRTRCLIVPPQLVRDLTFTVPPPPSLSPRLPQATRCEFVEGFGAQRRTWTRDSGAVAEENDLMLGIYAKVIRPGTVRLGDEVLLMDGLLK